MCFRFLLLILVLVGCSEKSQQGDRIAIGLVVVSIIATVAAILYDSLSHATKQKYASNPIELMEDTKSLTNTTVTDSLLGEVRSQLERRTEALQNIDAKISQFLTIVGGGAGAITLVSQRMPLPSTGTTALGAPGNGAPPLLVAAGLTLIMVLVNCVVALVPRNRQSADVKAIGRVYNVLPFLADPENKARLSYDLIVRYADSSAALKSVLRKKRWYFVAASSLFVLAIAAVFLNAALPTK